jgi:4-hydroxybutyrate CoA-transferase
MIIAEVTPNMPRTYGNSFIHVSEIDYIVETDSSPANLNPPQLSETDEKIGKNIAELIKDGDCLQLGIGAVPDAILHFLTDKKDLGIHSEMFSDGVVELVERGVVTCARKNFHPGKMVVTFLMGSERLYKFAHNNRLLKCTPLIM